MLNVNICEEIPVADAFIGVCRRGNDIFDGGFGGCSAFAPISTIPKNSAPHDETSMTERADVIVLCMVPLRSKWEEVCV
jgi:hypothetical protein